VAADIVVAVNILETGGVALAGAAIARNQIWFRCPSGTNPQAATKRNEF
jgi:hypothetical protein